ncbi:MAG: cell division protein ZapE [Gammaproteobacteria bacterium]
MSPREHYHADLLRHGWLADPAQQAAIEHLQRLYDAVQAPLPAQNPRLGLVARWLRSTQSAPRATPGLYLWGGVGRGKTYLLDAFFASLTVPTKLRLHFHRFMQRIHHELRTLGQVQDPLALVAHRLAEETRVLCLDEFFVSDITDAMILAGLLKGIFEQRVILVTTSNIAPDDLYQGGLQRARFLPAIDLIKTHLEVFHLQGATDYRLRSLEQAELYYCPADERAEQQLAEAFARLAGERWSMGGTLEIEGRPIPVVRQADGVVWFQFQALCDGPRSQLDFIEIARAFHTVIVSAIPVMDRAMEDQARRFLNLVDEFYDRHVKLIVSAAAPIADLYQGERLRFEYRRTTSRLREMQSIDYLSKPHLP